MYNNKHIIIEIKRKIHTKTEFDIIYNYLLDNINDNIMWVSDNKLKDYYPLGIEIRHLYYNYLTNKMFFSTLYSKNYISNIDEDYIIIDLKNIIRIEKLKNILNKNKI